MSDKTTSARCDVLHIRPSPPDAAVASPHAAGIVQALAAAGLAVETTTNVYEGLARLVEVEAPRPRAVIVSMDEISPAEMEFFPLVARACRGLAVYVYGRERHEHRLTTALEHGAAGRATVELVRSLAAARMPEARPPADAERPATAAREPDLEPESAAPPENTNPPEDMEEGLKEPPDDADLTAWEDEPDDVDGPVRVPWLRYPDRPARAAPQRTPPSPRRAEPAPPVPAPPTFALEPLLTDEELRALIGGDIASLAPRDPAPRPRGDDLSGKGTAP